MNYRSKYIIVKQGACTIPIVFGDLAAHSDVARAFPPNQVISAGFCYLNDEGRYSCYGDSVSLKLKSRDEDASLLNKFLGVVDED